jgi:hypothetical protein
MLDKKFAKYGFFESDVEPSWRFIKSQWSIPIMVSLVNSKKNLLEKEYSEVLLTVKKNNNHGPFIEKVGIHATNISEKVNSFFGFAIINMKFLFNF